jgi:hypothetical protein
VLRTERRRQLQGTGLQQLQLQENLLQLMSEYDTAILLHSRSTSYHMQCILFNWLPAAVLQMVQNQTGSSN